MLGKADHFVATASLGDGEPTSIGDGSPGQSSRLVFVGEVDMQEVSSQRYRWGPSDAQVSGM